MKHVQQVTITVRHSERRSKVEGRPDLGTYVAEWFTQHVVEVAIDVDAIASKLGPNAARAKTGKAVESGGHVVVRHLHVIAPTSAAEPVQGSK